MTKLDYSIAAKNVLSKFYRVDQIVYVEGDDDVLFWEVIFEKLGSIRIEPRQVGGRPELQKYIDDIVAGELDAIVAIDSDFTPFKQETIDHPRVLYTAGYSIENTIVSASTLAKVARNTGKIPRKNAPIERFQEWLDEFYDGISTLLINDLNDQCCGKQSGVIGENCDCFMLSGKCANISPAKIDEYLAKFGLEKVPALEGEVAQVIDELGLEINDFVRGHFLFSAARRFVCVFVEQSRSKISLSNAAFFGALILALEGCLDGEYLHFEHYKNSIERLQNAA